MMITCRELTELVTDYLEGRMPPEERTSFRLHADLCKPCRAFLEQMQHTVEILGRLPPDFEIPGEVKVKLHHLFCAWKDEQAAQAGSAHVREEAVADSGPIDLGPVQRHHRHGPCAGRAKDKHE